MLLTKLVTSNLRVRRTRLVLTVSAIALAVSLVVSVTSGYASIEAAAYHYLNMYMGSTDAQLSRASDPRAGMAESVVGEIRKDSDVKEVIGRIEMELGLIDQKGSRVQGRSATVVGVRRPEDRGVDKLTFNEGQWFNTSDGNVAVIDQAVARLLKDSANKDAASNEEAPSLHVGDTFSLPTGASGKIDLKVVGIVHKPTMFAAAMQTIYMPIETLQRAMTPPGSPPQVTRVIIDLKDGVDTAGWSARWKPKLAAIDPDLKLRIAADNRNDMDKNLQGLHILSYLGSAVSMLSATCIIFSTLAMGVTERQRTLAMLRAIGTTRAQLGRLVVLEGMVLAGLGIALGVPLGIGWIAIITHRYHDVFSAGTVVEKTGVLFAIFTSLGSALAASLFPAISAMRLDPLEAMSPLARQSSSSFPWRPTLFGLLLLCFDLMVNFGRWESWLPAMHLLPSSMGPEDGARAIHFYGHFMLGLPGTMFGFFLLAPMFVWTIERLGGRLISRLFNLRYALLRQQLSGGIWRAAGTCAALMVGLAVLVVMQTEGNSMLNSWRLPVGFPDIFIVTGKLGGLSEADQAKIAEVKGIKKGDMLPISIASPGLGSGIFAIVGAAAIPNATMFFGVDPDRAMRMLDLEFLEGDAHSAAEQLKLGRRVIIPDEFRQLKGLHIGSKLPLKTVKNGTVDYTVCGVIHSPGLDVIDSIYDLGGQMNQRTASSVFGSMDDAKNDFGVSSVYFCAANLELGLQKETLVKSIQAEVGEMGLKAVDIRELKYKIHQGFSRLLLVISTVAFAAMAVASLGVTNTIVASIRSRQWQFGILRSVGITRGGLLRLVLAEATLLGIVGAVLGVVAGLEMSVNANRLSRNMLGVIAPITIPWDMVWTGSLIVMAVALLASLVPAIRVSWEDPLSLLQAGRASA